jgi:hypothetical protein
MPIIFYPFHFTILTFGGLVVPLTSQHVGNLSSLYSMVGTIDYFHLLTINPSQVQPYIEACLEVLRFR